MKKKLIIGLVILFAVLGIVGGAAIKIIFFSTEEVADYYTVGQVSQLLLYLEPDSMYIDDEENSDTADDSSDDKSIRQVLTNLYDEVGDDKPFTAVDAKAVLDYFNISYDLLDFDLDKLKDKSVISKSQFNQMYDTIISNNNIESVVKKDIMTMSFSEVKLNAVREDGVASYIQGITNDGTYEFTQGEDMDMLDKVYSAYIYEDKVICVIGISDSDITINNAWIVETKDSKLHIFYEGLYKDLPCSVSDGSDVKGTLSDVIVSNSGVSKILTKSDIITAKVLSINDAGIEIEGYERLPISENYKIYKVYGDLAVERTSNILIGYDSTSFVVADGVIEASLITQEPITENIRVAISNDDFSSLKHKNVSFTADSDFVITYGEENKTFTAGETITINGSSEYWTTDRIKVSTVNENGKIQLLSVNRSCGNPCYRGTIEIAKEESEFIVVNELPLEEYLYAVVSSEMPTYYNVEALKTQAICARGYAYSKIQNSTYAAYGAHLDDSTMTQVYNNASEDEQSIFAVKDTYGMVPVYNGNVIQSYFFSTSCGVTCNNADVWAGDALPYLTDNYETVDKQDVDLSDNEAFKGFIDTSSGYNTFESSYPLYRWNITYSKQEITTAINSKLKERIDAAPMNLLVKNSNGNFVQKSIDTIGDVQSIEVSLRGKSGIVKEIIIEGSEATIKVLGQTNARNLMTPVYVSIIKQDGKEVNGWSSLPSPFYYVEATGDGFVIHGGGFGHGVGMSQNGANELANLSYTCDQIISHYYTDATLVNIYENTDSNEEADNQ